MKATQRDFARIARNAARKARIFLFCGPDEAGMHAAAAMITSLLPGSGERVELSGAELRNDPVRLGDEARSNSLFGATGHILVRAQGDEAHDAVANLVAGEAEACPVLIVASGASDKSRTAKLLAGRSDALVAMFYPPELGAVTGVVRNMADTAGLRMGGDIAERIARAANLDTRLAQSEIDKLALYLDASPEIPRSVEANHLDGIGAAVDADGFASLVNAVLAGQTDQIPDELKRLRDLGLNPVGVLLSFERRAAQLAALSAKLGSRRDIERLVEAETAARRIFRGDQAALIAQLRRWRGRRLHRLVDKLVVLHQSMFANSRDSELLLSQGLLKIAAYSDENI